jgi:hypothetical protein
MSIQEQAATPSNRVEQFKAEIGDMKLRDPRASRERMLLMVGVVLMVLGVVLAIVAYFQSSGADAAFNSEGPAEQRDAIVIGIVGASLGIVGAALFLRYSMAQFLRFWLARVIYEQKAQTDRIVEGRAPLDLS